MGYCITYHTKGLNGRRKRTAYRLPLLTGCFAILTVLLVRGCWPEGWSLLSQWLCPEPLTAAAAAVETLAEDLGAGKPLENAFGDFFRLIREGWTLAALR